MVRWWACGGRTAAAEASREADIWAVKLENVAVSGDVRGVMNIHGSKKLFHLFLSKTPEVYLSSAVMMKGIYMNTFYSLRLDNANT